MVAKKKTPVWIEEHLPSQLSDSKLFKFKIKLPNDQIVDIDLLDDVDIEYETLEAHLEQIPSQYIFWSAVYSELKFAISVITIKIDKRKAVVATSIRSKAVANKSKITDKQLNMLIDGDDVLNKLNVESVIMHKNAGKIYHMLEAIKMRSEHCRSLAGFKRQEKEQSTRLT